MNRENILFLSEKKIDKSDIGEIKNNLEKNYEISYGKYNNLELKKAIEKNGTPFFIKNHFIVGTDQNKFIDDDGNKLIIDKMIKAVIIEDLKDDIQNFSAPEKEVIHGYSECKNPWDFFQSILGWPGTRYRNFKTAVQGKTGDYPAIYPLDQNIFLYRR